MIAQSRFLGKWEAAVLSMPPNCEYTTLNE